VTATPDNNLLQVNNLKVHFSIKTGGLPGKEALTVKAVDGVHFHIKPGETLGLVGESGCGKSTTAKGVLQLEQVTEGQIMFKGEDLSRIKGETLRRKRRHMQMIFQDPFACLSPRMTVRKIIEEPLWVHGICRNSRERRQRAEEMMDLVGLSRLYVNRYPHEFSGGQRQRIGIARALAVQPDFIACDEPVSALDVSIQAQIINLLEDLRERFNISYLFISHDLSVVKHISDRVAVMYLGKIVELAGKKELYNNPVHPYTQALLSSIPIPDPALESKRTAIALKGEIPSPILPPSGCKFHPRCSLSEKICAESDPKWQEVSPGHFAACYFV
jgi:oligopeptide transport system ATP-binding protein